MPRARRQPRATPAPRRPPRHVTDADELAQVWVDAAVLGVSGAARAHDMDRVTVRSIRARVEAEPALLARAHEKRGRLAERVEASRMRAETVAYEAIARALSRPDVRATEAVNAAAELARIRGEHKGDAHQGTGGGRRPTLIVPSVLVRDRPDEAPIEVHGSGPCTPPEPDMLPPLRRTNDR